MSKTHNLSESERLALEALLKKILKDFQNNIQVNHSRTIAIPVLETLIEKLEPN